MNFVPVAPLLPITRKPEEGSGTSCNGAEDHPDHTIISAGALLASLSSTTRPHDAVSASSSSPSGEPSAGGMMCPQRPTTITDIVVCVTSDTSTGDSASRDGAMNIERPKEGPRPRDLNDAEIPRIDDVMGPFKLGKTFLGLTFQAAIALMIYREQPPPQGDSSANPSTLSSILFTTVGGTTLFAFAFTMSGMMLRIHHPVVANSCSYAGVLMGALGFFLMMSIFATKGLVWLVWAVGGILLMVFAYTLCQRMGISFKNNREEGNIHSFLGE